MTGLIAPHGGYENLKSFQMAQIAYDLNFQFCQKYVPSLKMRDQMEGAGRGGTQNIGEGSQTSGTSKQGELRLVDVARASMEELKLDYKAFLRQRNLAIWDKDDARALAIRKLAYESNKSYKTYLSYFSEAQAAANCVLCVANQAAFLLDRQLLALEKDLREKGDFRERYKQQIKKQIFGSREDDDEFLKECGLRRLHNGRVVELDAPEKFEDK
jgi:restriction system protein